MQLKQLPLVILLCFSAIGMALAQHNPLATEYYQAGESALLQKDYKKALRRFQQAVELQPELMAAERGIGLCYEMLKEYPAALTHYLKIVETAPKFSRALYYQIGEIYFKLGLYNKAIAYFDQFRRMQLMEDISFTVNGEKERVLEDQFLEKLEGNIRACQISMDTSKFNQNVRSQTWVAASTAGRTIIFRFCPIIRNCCSSPAAAMWKPTKTFFSVHPRTATGMKPAP
ncbi:MAG: tetratricopeptide repeat protein [Haliscomenobacter sp.]|nr:tetratricopeptide repeat protein [Haliscomenobacter sp.]